MARVKLSEKPETNQVLHQQVGFYLAAFELPADTASKKVGSGHVFDGGGELVVFVHGNEVGMLSHADADHLLKTGYKPGDSTDPDPISKVSA